MEYFKFGTNSCVVKHHIKNENYIKTDNVQNNINHIWLYDRSGSMYNVIDDLINQLVSLTKKIKIGDTLSLGYFSSEGQYDFILIGYKILNDTDYLDLERIIRKNNYTLGCTCFSEIIDKTSIIINNLNVFSNVFSFVLFTDGYPVVSNYKKEIDNINNAIDKIKGNVTTALLIGYGVHYNKSLMLDMATRLNASLIHNKSIDDFTPSVIQNIKLSESAKSVNFNYPFNEKPIASFIITDNGLLLLDTNNKQIISDSKDIYVYYIFDNKDVLIINDNIKEFNEVSPSKMVEGIYGSAVVLSQMAKTDKAIDIIGKLGDIYFIDKLNNAYTIEEYGDIENALCLAIYRNDIRFKEGKNLKYLPKDDAFCVLDVINILIDDEESKFYPYDKRFKYNKISKSVEIDKGYSEFIPDHNNECLFKNMIWNKNKLNLSIQTTVKGIIKLKGKNGKKAINFGFVDDYPTWQYKTYNFICDGIPNIKKIYIKTSEKTYKILKSKKIIFNDTYKRNKMYGISFENIPVINKVICENHISGTELCSLIFDELKLMAKIKVYKHYMNIDFPIQELIATNFNEEQQKFLIDNGIKIEDGSYSPMVVAKESHDYYMAKTFDIKIKGCSVLPSVNKVINKKEKLTFVESIINDAITQYNNHPKLKEPIESELKKFKIELQKIRTLIQKTKFSIILGKKWFDEFGSREETTLIVDGVTYNFILGEEKVKY